MGRQALRVAACGVTAALLGGCSSAGPDWQARTLSDFGAAIDRAEQYVSDYGYGTISAPLPALPPVAPNTGFAFDLNRKAGEFYNDVKEHRDVSLAETLATALQTGLGAQASFDPVAGLDFSGKLDQYNRQRRLADEIINARLAAAAVTRNAALEAAAAETDETARAAKVAAAQQAYAESLGALRDPSATFPAATIPSAMPAADLAPDAAAARALLPTDRLSAYNSLVSSRQPTLSPIEALMHTASLKTLQGIFEALGQPFDSSKYADRVNLVTVCMVAVEPGRLTRKDFALDVSASVRWHAHRLLSSNPEERKAIVTILQDMRLSDSQRGLLDDCLLRAVAVDTARRVADEQIAVILAHPDEINRIVGRPDPLRAAAGAPSAVAAEDVLRRVRQRQDELAEDVAAKATNRRAAQGNEPKGSLAALESADSVRRLQPDQMAQLLDEIGSSPSSLGENGKQQDAALLSGLADLKTTTELLLKLQEPAERYSKARDALVQVAEDAPVIETESGPLPFSESANVVAVSPMVYGQVLDQTSSVRRQTETALSLAAVLARAGLKAEAEYYWKWARQRQADLATVTTNNTISAYSTGAAFGYRVLPSLVLEDGKLTRTLQAQTFPVLVVISEERSNLAPRLVYRAKKGEAHTDLSKLAMMVPEARLVVTHRWQPLSGDERGIKGWGAGLWRSITVGRWSATPPPARQRLADQLDLENRMGALRRPSPDQEFGVDECALALASAAVQRAYGARVVFQVPQYAYLHARKPALAMHQDKPVVLPDAVTAGTSSEAAKPLQFAVYGENLDRVTAVSQAAPAGESLFEISEGLSTPAALVVQLKQGKSIPKLTELVFALFYTAADGTSRQLLTCPGVQVKAPPERVPELTRVDGRVVMLPAFLEAKPGEVKVCVFGQNLAPADGCRVEVTAVTGEEVTEPKAVKDQVTVTVRLKAPVPGQTLALRLKYVDKEGKEACSLYTWPGVPIVGNATAELKLGEGGASATFAAPQNALTPDLIKAMGEAAARRQGTQAPSEPRSVEMKIEGGSIDLKPK